MPLFLQRGKAKLVSSLSDGMRELCLILNHVKFVLFFSLFFNMNFQRSEETNRVSQNG